VGDHWRIPAVECIFAYGYCLWLLPEPSFYAKIPAWLPPFVLSDMIETFTPPGTVSIAKRRRANGRNDQCLREIFGSAPHISLKICSQLMTCCVRLSVGAARPLITGTNEGGLHWAPSAQVWGSCRVRPISADDQRLDNDCRRPCRPYFQNNALCSSMNQRIPLTKMVSPILHSLRSQAAANRNANPMRPFVHFLGWTNWEATLEFGEASTCSWRGVGAPIPD
jgi:hypothetical protein